MKRFIIAGPPCAGKSSFVRNRIQPGDLVYDYDSLHSALSGQESHYHLNEIRPYVLKARDAIFDELETHGQQAAWIITSTRSAENLTGLAERFNADIIFLNVDRDECHQRANLDNRPAEWHIYINNWFEESDIGEDFKSRSLEMNVYQKIFTAPICLKSDGNEGEFTAEFATLNVIDLDGDVTLNGAFKNGQETIIEAWNHTYSDLPVGKGIIKEIEGKAVIDGQFFLDTVAGLEHYKTVKNLGELQQWSYTFTVEESSTGDFDGQDVMFLEKLDVWGVAPVQRGAGVDTRTITIKSSKRAIPAHSTPTVDTAWDGPGNVRRARSGESVAYYRRIFAYQDMEGDPEVKSSWKFPHHEVSGDGNPGAANVRGCIAGIAVLNGGRGGANIPDSDRRGVWNHLARHMRDGDMEPPELKSETLEDGEGEDGNVKPSGVSPSVILAQIELIEMEISENEEKN